MQTVTAVVKRPPDVCWRVLTDPSTFPGWVPGLRRARVVTTDDADRPREVQFDFGPSRTYSLVYSYAPNEVTWEPGLGRRDAVRGFARIAPTDDGHTALTYGLEGSRPEEEQDVAAIVAAFTTWMHSAR